MLSLLISIPITALAVWLILRGVVSLSKKRAGSLWWAAFITTVVVGGYVGFQLSHYEIQVSPTLRWGGLPLPIGAFHLENGEWVDYVLSSPIQRLNVLADTLFPIIVLLLSWMAIFRRRFPIPNP